MDNNLTRKSNFKLACLLLRFVNEEYDGGGVSYGRSQESLILEAVLSSWPLSEITHDDEKLEFHSLMVIAAKLVEESEYSDDPVLYYDQLGIISDKALGYFLLGYLEKLYQSGQGILSRLAYRHLPIIRLALSLAAISFSAKIQTRLSLESLLTEADSRKFNRHLQAYKASW